MAIDVRVTEQKIDIADLIEKVTTPEYGAIDIFIGTVRNHHNGKEVTGITYDAHEKLAEKILKEICTESMGLWPETRYAIAHYKGDLRVGEMSIAIAVSSPHRAESFEACRYVIEEIKTYVPVWKKEHYTDGKSDWLPGHSLRHEVDVSTCCGKCSGGGHA